MYNNRGDLVADRLLLPSTAKSDTVSPSIRVAQAAWSCG